MSNDQFKTLAQMINGVHNDVASLSTSVGGLEKKLLLQFHKVFAHLQSHDGDLRMIKKEMLDQGKSPKALAGIETEVISHERRLKTVESELGIPRVSF